MPTEAEASFLSSPSGWGLGSCTGHRSRSWPFPGAALNLPSPAAGGGQAARFGAVLQRRRRQAAPERPGPNSSSPVEARQGSRALAGGLQGLWPEWEGLAVRGRGLPLSPPHPAVCLLWVTCGWGRHRKASGVPAAPVAWLPSVPLALEERFYLRHSAQSSRVCYKSGGQGGVRERRGGGGPECWVLWGLLGSSPARVGSRLGLEGRMAPVYSSSRQRCRESWLSA